MNHDRGSDNSPDHREISELIPWYLNGSIGDADRQRVDAHLRACAACRDELSLERRVYEGMAAEAGVEYMPAGSLKRLQARIDGLGTVPPAKAAPRARRSVRRSAPWQGVMAASIVVTAVALGVLAADRWMQYRARPLPPSYYTVTAPAPRAPDEVIRAVFSPAISLAELQAILDEAQLRIVSGPTAAGVYSLAANSDRPVNASLALLRRHAAVRFAESTRPESAPSDSP